MIDCGIDGSGNLAKEYFPDVIHRSINQSNNEIAYALSRDGYRDVNQSVVQPIDQSTNQSKSWWESTNWFRGQSQAPTNQPTHTIDLTQNESINQSMKHIIDAPGHAACFNRFATTKPKPINQTTNQSFEKSNNQLTNQPTIQVNKPSINQSVNQSISQTVNPALNRSINPATTVKQSVNQSAKRVVIDATLAYPSHVARSINQSIIAPLYHPLIYQSINLSPSRCVLLTGSSGQGKSHLYHQLINQLNVYSQRLDMINYSSVTSSINQSINQSVDLTKTCIDYAFETVRKNAPAILFLDDLDMIAASQSTNQSFSQPINQLTVRMRNSLIKQIDDLVNQSIDRPVIVIGACLNDLSVDRSFVKPGRFDQSINLSKPDTTGRKHLITQSINQLKCESIDVSMIADRTVGWSCVDIVALCREAGMEAVRQAINQSTDQSTNQPMTNDEIDDAYTLPLDVQSTNLSINQSHFESALTKIRPSIMNEFTASQAINPSTKWSQIGGYQSIKQRLIESVVLPIRYPHLFSRYNQSINQSGALLYGPPGTGKTQIAKAMADCLNDQSIYQSIVSSSTNEFIKLQSINASTNQSISFISIKGPELLDSYLGVSEKKIRELFSKVRQSAPSILFIDEIDSIAPRRGQSINSSNSTIDRVVNTLLMELDDRPMVKKSESTANPGMVFVIAATNRPDMIDPALLRPGRLEQLIHVKLPDVVDRLDILKATLTDTPVDQSINQSDLQNLVDRMDGFSGADIAHVVHKAQKMAVRKHVDRLINQPINQSASQSTNDEFVTLEQLERALSDTLPSATVESIARCVLFEQGLDQADYVPSTNDESMNDELIDGLVDDQEMKEESDEKQPNQTINQSMAIGQATDKNAPHLAQLRASIKQSISQSINAGATPQQALNLILEQFVSSKKPSDDDEKAQPGPSRSGRTLA